MHVCAEFGFFSEICGGVSAITIQMIGSAYFLNPHQKITNKNMKVERFWFQSMPTLEEEDIQ